MSTSEKGYYSLSNLPIDILYHIFDLYQSLDQRPYSSLRLTQVCSHWRHAGLGFARLWNHFSISLNTPIPIISLYFERSRDTPLVLDCDLRLMGRAPRLPEETRRQTGRRSTIWNIVFRTATRWRHLSLQFDSVNAPDVVHDLAQAYTPMLERLLLWTDVSNNSGAQVLGKGVLNLEALSLKGVPLRPFISSALRTLKRLELSTDQAISLADFRDAVGRMPHLEYLGLRGNVVADWPIQLRKELIQIPSLRSLYLAEQRVPLAIPLLSISAPSLYEITLVDLTTRDLPSPFIPTILRENYASIRSLVLLGGSTKLSVDAFHYLFRLFPELDHLALIQVNEFLVHEFTYALQLASIWPQLQTICVSSTLGGDNVIASQHSSSCGWEAARLSTSARLTRSEWLAEFSW